VKPASREPRKNRFVGTQTVWPARFAVGKSPVTEFIPSGAVHRAPQKKARRPRERLSGVARFSAEGERAEGTDTPALLPVEGPVSGACLCSSENTSISTGVLRPQGSRPPWIHRSSTAFEAEVDSTGLRAGSLTRTETGPVAVE